MLDFSLEAALKRRKILNFATSKMRHKLTNIEHISKVVDKMGCNIFLWRFLTFNEINFMKSDRALVGMRAQFGFESPFISIKMTLATYFLCFPLFS